MLVKNININIIHIISGYVKCMNVLDRKDLISYHRHKVTLEYNIEI